MHTKRGFIGTHSSLGSHRSSAFLVSSGVEVLWHGRWERINNFQFVTFRNKVVKVKASQSKSRFPPADKRRLTHKSSKFQTSR
jgi:hypothetical protein